MGQVYRATDTKLRRDVALKILPDEFAVDPERLSRFEREAHTLAALNHSGIAAIYGIEEFEGTLALVLELVSGPTLEDLIARHPIPVAEALRLAIGIAAAVEAAHERGIIHRDLKPANIKIQDDGTVKVLDFGIAKALSVDSRHAQAIESDAPTQTATAPGVILGTAAYMSPEQARGMPVDERTDVWAFGCILFEMLTGRRPFAGAHFTDVLANVLKEEPDYSELPADTPPLTRRLLRRCLEKDRRDRLRHIGDARADLRDSLELRDSVSSSSSRAASAVESVERQRTTAQGRAHATGTGASRVLTLVFTDLVDSTGLKRRLGDRPAGVLIARHQELVRRLAGEAQGREVDAAGDGFFLTFDTPSAGAAFALRLQRAHQEDAELPRVRVGIHLGEVTEHTAPEGAATTAKVEGLAVDVAARIQALAQPGQVLLSRAAFDGARQRLARDEVEGEIAWRAHGAYLLEGLDEPMEIGEVGLVGLAPLEAPPDSDQAKRSVTAADELTLGWRPAVGLAIPGRDHWRLEAQLGIGAIGEVWLATHEKTHAKRVFKFCFEAERVRGLRREVVLLRLLRERLGERQDIAQVLDWEFDRPPFFIETAYTEAGDLLQWAKERGGIGAVPIETRLDIVAQAARALAAAHGAGVLHKDLKPSNLLIREADATGRPQVCLTDFGIGLVTSREALAEAGVTMAGLTETLLSSSTSTGAGTRLYMAPEVIEGKPATAASDVYALGVLLYQMVVGDFSRSLASSWHRDVTDEELAEDIAACVDGVPEKRLGSAADLAERLERVADRRRERSETSASGRRERSGRASGVAGSWRRQWRPRWWPWWAARCGRSRGASARSAPRRSGCAGREKRRFPRSVGSRSAASSTRPWPSPRRPSATSPPIRPSSTCGA